MSSAERQRARKDTGDFYERLGEISRRAVAFPSRTDKSWVAGTGRGGIRGGAVGARPHILIVDDDPGIREALGAALAGAYVVHATATGDGASALLKRRPVAAIVLDAILGEEHGLDLVQRIRALSPAPILILTGHGSEDLAARALRTRVRMTHLGIEQVAQAVGYARVTTFDRIFKRAFRRTPSAYRQGAESRGASSEGEKSGSAL